MDRHITELVERYPILESNAEAIFRVYEIMVQCFENGGKLLVAGNGGSASDADHIVGELMKGFRLPRKISEELNDELSKIDSHMGRELSQKLQGALPAIALHNHSSLNTAFLNDVDGNLCFAQQIMGYGKPSDVFMAISTSGNSQNIIYAAITAKAKGLKVVGLTGVGGRLSFYTDEIIAVKSDITHIVQELHLPVYHCLCLMLENYFWKKNDDELLDIILSEETGIIRNSY